MGYANMGLFVPVVVRRKFMVYFGCLANIALVVAENYDWVKNKSRVPDARLFKLSRIAYACSGCVKLRKVAIRLRIFIVSGNTKDGLSLYRAKFYRQL